MVQTFADQAVIAIQNVRQFNETQEALERQTATADILKVIASSPSDVQPVFEAIATSANRLIGGVVSSVWRFADDTARLEAHTPIDRAAEDALKAMSPRPLRDFPAFALVRDGRAFVVVDTEVDDIFNRELARLVGFRSILRVPLMSLGEPIGLITATRKEPGAFTTHEVQLLQTFADQAVIAIQNARLFNETQEALERQQASAEILGVISNSIADAQPVFERILESTRRIIASERVAIYIVAANEQLQCAAMSGQGSALIKAQYPMPLAQTSAPVVIALRRQVCYPDVMNDPDAPDSLRRVAAQTPKGNYSVALTPLLWEGAAIGMLTVARDAGVTFNDKDLSLLRMFADQAVIAIQNARLFNETKEALQQQTATADVLKVISRSAFDLQAVLDTLVRSAVELSDASIGVIYLQRDNAFHLEAHFGLNPEYTRYLEQNPQKPGRGSGGARVLLTGEVQNIADVQADPEYDPAAKSIAPAAILAVPLIRDRKVVGAINVGRSVAGAFSRRHIELVQTFADQAIIAIENVRLFDEVQARTRDLQEALQQQTATAEVLKVISRSTFDLDPVLTTLTESARNLCGAANATIFLRDGDYMRVGAGSGHTPEFIEFLRRNPIRAGRETFTGRVMLTGEVVELPDVLADPEYGYGPAQRLGNYRAALGVPLLRDGRVEGVFSLSRPEPGTFTPRQIELVRAFADQALIAIENVRLFDEVQARTRDLTEALQQQTATADILKVIASSPSDVQPVFDAVADRAMRLLKCWSVVVTRYDGEQLHFGAACGALPDTEAYVRRLFPQRPDPDGFYGRCILDKRPVNDPDRQSCPDLKGREYARVRGFHAALAVPMLAEGSVIGLITATRETVGAFAEEDVRLLRTFADQAAIAINNVSLFNETQEALKRSRPPPPTCAEGDQPLGVQTSADGVPAYTLLGSAVEIVWRGWRRAVDPRRRRVRLQSLQLTTVARPRSFPPRKSNQPQPRECHGSCRAVWADRMRYRTRSRTSCFGGAEA